MRIIFQNLITAFKRVIQVVISLLILLALLFLPAGRLDWAMAWVFLGTYLGAVAITVAFLATKDPGLLKERRQVKEGVKTWDQVLTNLFGLVALPAVLVVAGLDVRYGWSQGMSPAIQIAALIVGMLGYALGIWSMVTNTFFATYVRIQEDRGHTAVSAGPYRFVRHPGYVAMMTAALTTPLILGSAVALIPAGFGAGLLIIRTALEDRALQAELDGYKTYAGRVRYRLLPGVW